VNIQPDSLGNIQPAREDALIAVRTLDNAVIVNWHLKNLNGLVNWDTNVQGIFVNDGQAGIKSGIHNWNEDFFTLSSGSVGCNVSGGGSWSGNLASVKTLLNNNDVEEFSLLCRASGVATFTTVTPEAIALPEITSLSSNTSTVTPENLLAASTKQVVQVRSEVAGVYSAYSSPVSFTTRAADTDYAWAYPTDVAFTANETKTLTFTLTNNGTEEGNSTIGIRLPFNVLGNVVSGTFSVKVNDGSGCPLNISAGKTTYTCSGVKVPVNGSVTVTVSLALPTTVTAIEYAIDGDYKNLPVVVTASGSGSNNTNTTTTESSSSSSGGALAWPLLLLPLLMFRRYKKAA
ncbi:MAG: GlyGly-CTERM sorting domain-containing protein, partial [Venatoribacter sp.]